MCGTYEESATEGQRNVRTDFDPSVPKKNPKTQHL